MIRIYDMPMCSALPRYISPIYILEAIVKKTTNESYCCDFNVLYYKYFIETDMFIDKIDIYSRWFAKYNSMNKLIPSYFFTLASLFNYRYQVDKLNELIKYNSIKIDDSDIFLSPILTEIDKINNEDTILISVRYSYLLAISVLFSRLIKEKYPKVKIIFGGSFFRTTTKHVIKFIMHNFKFIDLISFGYAETNLMNIIRNEDIRAISNISYRTNNNIYFTKNDFVNYVENADVSTTILSDYQNNPLLPVNIGYGCYWGKCHYCNFNDTDSVYLSLNGENTFTVLKKYYDEGFRNFSITQDCISYAWVNKLHENMKKNNMLGKINLYTFLRGDKFPDRFYDKLKEIGVKEVSLGVESFSQKMQDIMNKGTKVQNCIDVIKALGEKGISIQLNIIPNYIGISNSDTELNIKYISELSEYINTLHLSKLYISHKTELFNQCIKNNLISEIEVRENIGSFFLKSNAELPKIYDSHLKLLQAYINNKENLKNNIHVLLHSQEFDIEFKEYIFFNNQLIIESKEPNLIHLSITTSDEVEFIKNLSKSSFIYNFKFSDVTNHVKLLILSMIMICAVKLVNRSLNKKNTINFNDYYKLTILINRAKKNVKLLTDI